MPLGWKGTDAQFLEGYLRSAALNHPGFEVSDFTVADSGIVISGGRIGDLAKEDSFDYHCGHLPFSNSMPENRRRFIYAEALWSAIALASGGEMLDHGESIVLASESRGFLTLRGGPSDDDRFNVPFTEDI